MHAKHWSWAYFVTDGKLFHNNSYYKNTWCKVCLNHHKEQLRKADIVTTVVSGTSGGRTDVESVTAATLDLKS